MKTKFAASVLSALLYAQGLLGFAGAASVLLKDRAHAADQVIALSTSPDLATVR